MINTLKELRKKTIEKYRIEKSVRDIKKENTKLREKCTEDKEHNAQGFREGCFEEIFKAMQGEHYNPYSFFDASEGADLCEHCEKYMKNRDVLMANREKLGKIKREITNYAKKELL